MKFNNQQLQSIEFYKGACQVLAAAGSGKSSVLLNRVKHLITHHNVLESDILTISFTRKTADELKGKLAKMGFLNVQVGTFHSICGRILAQEGIYINNLIKEWQIENLLKKINPKADVKEITSFISYQKNYLRGIHDEFIPKYSNYLDEELREYYKAYESFKQKNRLYDFDDYLVECYKVLKANPNKYTYEFVLVDEHQDSNLVQNLLLKEWCMSGNIFAVGDPRQSIYGFRGSNVEYFMNFEKDWINPTVINMDINYRSVSNIVHQANTFIKPYFSTFRHYSDSISHHQNNGNIIIKNYMQRENEAKEVVDHIEKVIQTGEKLNEIAVLYRLNSHASFVENELRKRDIPYEISNEGSFFKRKEILGIMGYLRLIHNPHDDHAFETIFKFRNYPLNYFASKVLEDVKVYSGLHNLSYYESFLTMKQDKPWMDKNVHTFEEGISRLRFQLDKGIGIKEVIDNIVKVFKMKEYITDKYTDKEELEDRLKSIQVLKSFVKGDDVQQFINFVDGSSISNNKKNKNSVKLMSIHASKGLEFNHVYLIGIEDGKFPHERSSVEEEARLFYVGVTRSKENLYISEIGMDNQFVVEYR